VRGLRDGGQAIEDVAVVAFPRRAQVLDQRLIDLEVAAAGTPDGAGFLLTLRVANLLDVAEALTERTQSQRAAQLGSQFATDCDATPSAASAATW
jgi:hypothetical protein